MEMVCADSLRRPGGLTTWLAFSLTAVLLAGCGITGPTAPPPGTSVPAASMPTATTAHIIAAARLHEPELGAVNPGLPEAGGRHGLFGRVRLTVRGSAEGRLARDRQDD